MFNWFKSFKPPSRYRIRQVPGGYIAIHRPDDYIDIEWMIRRDGGEGVSTGRLDKSNASEYVVETMEEAGQRINSHSSMTNGKIVWEGG